MQHRVLLVAIVMVSAVFVGCTESGAGPAMENPIEPCGELDTDFEPDPRFNPRVEIETTNGTMTVLVFARQVPFTAGHFKQLIQDATYEDTRFHRLVPDLVIFGGDPRSSSDNRDAWGSGGYNLRTVDELHQFLRHDEPGTVSLVSARPNAAGSQFMVTLVPQPAFDDRHPVFGRIIAGLGTAEQISNIPTDDRERPLYGAQIQNITWIDDPAPEEPAAELNAYGYDCVEVGEPGDKVEHMVAVRNTGQGILNGTVESPLDADDGWELELGAGERLVLSSGQTGVYAINVTIPEDAEVGTERSTTVEFTGQGSDVGTDLTFTTHVAEMGERAADQDEVQIRYIGVLDDGRPFDTTEPVYTQEPSLRWFLDRPADPKPATLPITDVTLNESQQGQLIERARLGETVVGFVSPEDAYGADSYGENNLGGRVLAFQVLVNEAE